MPRLATSSSRKLHFRRRSKCNKLETWETKTKDDLLNVLLAYNSFLSDGFQDGLAVSIDIIPLNRLLCKCSCGFYHMVRDKTAACALHQHVVENPDIGRHYSRGASGRECRIPQLCGMLAALRFKFPDGLAFERQCGKTIHMRCPECAWEASTVRSKRSSDESKAASFLPCSNCSGVVLFDALRSHCGNDVSRMTKDTADIQYPELSEISKSSASSSCASLRMRRSES